MRENLFLLSSTVGVGFIAGTVLWGIFTARRFKMEKQIQMLLVVWICQLFLVSFCIPQNALVLAGTLAIGEVIGWRLSRIGYSP